MLYAVHGVYAMLCYITNSHVIKRYPLHGIISIVVAYIYLYIYMFQVTQMGRNRPYSQGIKILEGAG